MFNVIDIFQAIKFVIGTIIYSSPVYVDVVLRSEGRDIIRDVLWSGSRRRKRNAATACDARG